MLLAGCANPIAPTGGPRDEVPPSLITAESTPGEQVRFRPEAIELTFNEWVKVQDPYKQIIISPPLQHRFDVSIRKRTVILAFDDREQLRDDATYVINFGTAIKDLTEGNAAKDLRFVFSTGDQIDSLSVAGRVVDAYTAAPVENALFLLYENVADSVVRKERPFYFGITNKQGQFSISNVKAGQFKVAALLDADANYLYNQPTEPFAFSDSLLTIGPEPSDSLLMLLSVKPLPLRILSADTSAYGRCKLVFNQPPPANLLLLVDSLTTELYTDRAGDSLFIWKNTDSSWQLRVQLDAARTDTLKIFSPTKGEAPVAEAIPMPVNYRHNPGLPLRLNYNLPIAALDSSRVRLLADSMQKETPFVLSVAPDRIRTLEIRAGWGDNTPYQLQLFPGAVSTLFGTSNTDTLIVSFTTDSRKNFGNLLLEFNDYDPDQQFIAIIKKKGGAESGRFVLRGEKNYRHSLPSLSPGAYELELIHDRNRNGRWDGGDYDAGIQPEPVKISSLEQLRANWDLEVTVDPWKK
jgi:uncharacterized protein (DUF2141 family)